MARVRKATLAEDDLEEIWLHIAAADALLDKLAAKTAVLASNAELGRVRPEIHEGLRSFAVGNYILFLSTRARRH